jgi:hypothetical protein
MGGNLLSLSYSLSYLSITFSLYLGVPKLTNGAAQTTVTERHNCATNRHKAEQSVTSGTKRHKAYVGDHEYH